MQLPAYSLARGCADELMNPELGSYYEITLRINTSRLYSKDGGWFPGFRLSSL
jgi:hypothetical protein